MKTLTPRTDAFEEAHTQYDNAVFIGYQAKFCRELERENAELRRRLAAFEAITSGSQHMAVDRALTTPPSGHREGMMQAAVIAENLVPGHSLEIGEAIRAEAEKLPQSHCVWRQEESNTWAGDCGALWTFTDGGPKDNQFAFCPQCGRAAQEERK